MSLLIACCQTLNVLLENEVKDKKGHFEGIYTIGGFSAGMNYWADTDGENAIWYLASGSTYYWMIGGKASLGSYSVSMYSSSNTLKNKCPNNEGYVWNWNFVVGNSSMATNCVSIKCANENDFCTSDDPCGTDEGDCDIHDDCQDGLFCGSNNCPDSLGFHSEFDCCYVPAVGDEHFCTIDNPCTVDQGDCDSNTECQENLFCDIEIFCPPHLGFASGVNCCSSLSRCKIYQTTNE